MPFSSILFVCAFLPACLAAYFLAPARARNAVALGASLLFYAWGAPKFLPVVLALGVADFYVARAIARAAGPRRKRLLAAAVCVHVAVLAYFKYANFAVAQAGFVASIFGAGPLHWSEVALPIGISFLTFEEISYVTDVFRGDAAPARRGGHYLLFLMLFPHSIAGPIFRWKDLAAQLESRVLSSEGVWRGVSRFSFGLAKKILVADSAALVADACFGLPANETTALYAWAGALAYAIQIYFDFSGYSDMAIGLGSMLGFTFKENFQEPYSSASIGEFWTRWHISLSSWLRDYLYIPLGGNRLGPRRAELNAMIVFAVSGLWHGAAWTFLFWGLYHGVLVSLERRAEPVLGRVPIALRCALTFALVVVGWVLFRAKSLAQAGWMLGAMFGAHHATVEAKPLPAEMFPNLGLVAIAGASVWIAWRIALRSRDADRTRRLPSWELRPAISLVLLAASIAHMTNMKYTPLIYFKF